MLCGARDATAVRSAALSDFFGGACRSERAGKMRNWCASSSALAFRILWNLWRKAHRDVFKVRLKCILWAINCQHGLKCEPVFSIKLPCAVNGDKLGFIVSGAAGFILSVYRARNEKRRINGKRHHHYQNWKSWYERRRELPVTSSRRGLSAKREVF